MPNNLLRNESRNDAQKNAGITNGAGGTKKINK